VVNEDPSNLHLFLGLVEDSEMQREEILVVGQVDKLRLHPNHQRDQGSRETKAGIVQGRPALAVTREEVPTVLDQDVADQLVALGRGDEERGLELAIAGVRVKAFH